MFEVDLGKIKFKWRGAYDNTTAYEPDDVVSNSGTSFICVNSVTGVTPVTSANPFWQVMALGSDLGSVAANAGDIFYYDGTNFQNVGAGAQGQVLTQGGLNTPTWITPDVVAPVIQQRAYIDYIRAQIDSGNSYYFGQSTTGVTITPRKFTSIIKVEVELFGEVSSHNAGYRIAYSTNNAASWNYMRLNQNGQERHGQLNPYEATGADYASTPGHTSCTLLQAFSTLNPICFRVYIHSGNWKANSSWSSAYERAQSSIILSELNSDYNSITYNGGA